MLEGLIGQKIGMTQIFDPDGHKSDVTVIEIAPNYVTQLKTPERDGYRAVQVTTGSKKANRVNQARKGHFAKAKVEAGRGLWELKLTDEAAELELGAAITIDQIFEAGQIVDVTSKSIGKGFQGAVKRHNFRTQDATHGNSLAHRAPGSTGMCQTPGRVFKGKKMAGQMGNKRTTVQNQQIIKLDTERNLLMVKGSVPGAPGGDVIVKHAVKHQNKRNKA